MDQKKMIIIGASAVGVIILIGVTIAVCYKSTPSKMEHLKLHGTWFEAVGACGSQKKKLIGNIKNATQMENIIKNLKGNELKENDTFWLSSIAFGQKTVNVTDFVDLYTGNALENVSINGKGNCLAAKYSTRPPKSNKFNYFKNSCFEKREFYVLCVNF